MKYKATYRNGNWALFKSDEDVAFDCLVDADVWDENCHNNDNKIIDGEFVPNHIPDRTYWLNGKEYTLVHPAILPEGASFNPTFDDAYTQKQEEIVTAHNVFLKAQSVKYSDMERETWSDQRVEAEVLAADSDASAPLVRAIAQGRNMEVMELVKRIQLKAQRWAQVAGYATGQRLSYQDALDGCTTVEEIKAITVAFALPDDIPAATESAFL